jgi:peptidoglycan/xylan/chitin deacetylase (PgdA/CDA1 family)
MNHLSPDKKPLAALSLDLDNQWAYMKTHGDAGWEEYPSYFDILIPYLLNFLDRLDLKMTFFIVGQDAALEKNRVILKSLTERGHDIGNHGFHHQQWFHQYSKDQLRAEVLEAEEQIFRVTGEKPAGFRGPGFSWSSQLLEVLAENDYLFDSSIFPTYIGPLIKAYYFWISTLSKEQKTKTKEIFPSFREGRWPIKPYRWQLASGDMLLEIPLTTMPLLKMPFHMSYLLYLSRYSTFLMSAYLQLTLLLLRMSRTSPIFLMHPTDFIDRRLVPELSFFPGMEIPRSRKTKLMEKVLQQIRNQFILVDMTSYARSFQADARTRVCSPY